MNGTSKRKRKTLDESSKMFVFFGQLIFIFSCTGLVLPTSSLPGVQKFGKDWSDIANEPLLMQKELNLTGSIGNTVSMPCRVKYLEDKTVLHDLDSEDWWLQLKRVTKADEGLYDCQINTYPKMSTKVYLKVFSKEGESSLLDRPISDTGISPLESGTWRELTEDSQQSEKDSFGVILMIWGSPLVQLDIGKTLHLTCEATRSNIYPRLFLLGTQSEERIIRWTLDDLPVEILFPEWKVNIKESWTERGIQSELRLNSVTSGDAGKISCIAPEATSATINFAIKEKKLPKQLYLGLSTTNKYQHHHYTYPMSSAVSGGCVKGTNGRFVVVCIALMFFFVLTNIAVCCHYFSKT